MVDSKENYKFNLGVKVLKTGPWSTLKLFWCDPIIVSAFVKLWSNVFKAFFANQT